MPAERPGEPVGREGTAFPTTARVTGRERVLGVPPQLEPLSTLDFFASLPWGPRPADPEKMTAEEFLEAL